MRTRKQKQKDPFRYGYSEEFKRKVIEEYLRTGSSKQSIQNKYNIASKSAIFTWMKQIGCDDIHKKNGYFEPINTIELKKKYSQNPEPDTEDVAVLKKQIKDLEYDLESEKLRSEAYMLMIEIAEKEYKIPIVKKRSTK